MLETFRAEWIAYVNSRWARWIFVGSSVAIIVASFVFWVYLGFGSESGTGSGAKVVGILSFLIAIPVILIFNLALALLWSLAAALFRSVAS